MEKATDRDLGVGPRVGLARSIVGMFRRPALTLEEFAKVPSGWRRGLTLMALMALAYTVVDVQLAFNGVAPIPDPFLRIPAGEYYKWAALFYGAAILAGWLLATGVMQLAARAAGGVGEFESLVAATGLATAVATLPTLIPDLITSTSGIYDTWATSGLSTALPWLYMALYVFLFLVYYPLAVAAVHDVSRGRAIVIGLTGYLLYQGFIFIFIR